VAALKVGEKVRASGLMQTFEISESLALKVLSQAVSAGSLAPRFRVRTELLLDGYLNDWRSSFAEIPQKVVDEFGTEIDVSQATNIEVAYERVPIEH
jgi:hypothetical protein